MDEENKGKITTTKFSIVMKKNKKKRKSKPIIMGKY